MRGSILNYQDHAVVLEYESAINHGRAEEAERIYDANTDLQVHFRNVKQRFEKAHKTADE